MGRKHRSGNEFEISPSYNTIKKRSKPSSKNDGGEINTTKQAKKLPRAAKKLPAPSQIDDKLSNSHGITRVNDVAGNKTQNEHKLVIPCDLYMVIGDVLDMRKNLETNKKNEDFQLRLKLLEGRVQTIASYHIASGILPTGWKFDPATASNLVRDKFIPAIITWGKPEKSEGSKNRCNQARDPKIELPNIYKVPLTDRERVAWLDFIEIDKGTDELRCLQFVRFEEQKTSFKSDHSFVHVIGAFAVMSYNKAFKMHVKKEEHNYLHDFVVADCKYHKLLARYWFYMTIEATEEGKRGLYKTKVECDRVDGRMTLCKFQRKKEKGMTSTYNMEEDVDGWCNPEEYYYTGLVRSTRFKGYDYHNPFGFDRV